ncbi:MAG: L-fucose/L-arabinose isomerase family protein [Chloroflexota bacterium]|nr:L-fucose/L-arabinose isomerase family protein [Anaerolineae bacterium]
MQSSKLGVIIGNRGFFPDHLCESGRDEILRILEEEGISAVVLSPKDTMFGSVETQRDAETCAELFRQHRDEIDGVLVTLPNFGDERGVANALRRSGLDVPVLVQAFPDEAAKMAVTHRRDSFCGKMSVCNNLWQYGILFSLTRQHTVAPDSLSFRQDLRQFVATCRVVRGLRRAKVGALGTRPGAFTTVRYSEKMLERAGISVEVLDLSEAFGRANHLADDDLEVRRKLDEIRAYVSTEGIPAQALAKMAKFALVVERWIGENELVATAVQCWTSMEEFFGVVPCTVMSMLSNTLIPCACETDITGALGMYAMQLSSGMPSALVDWNNNYGGDPDKGVVFHCSNLPKSLFADMRMDYQAIIAGTVGKENTYGTVVGRVKSGPFTFCRVSTDDSRGVMRAYVGEGELTDDPLETFGGYGVVCIPDFQRLLHYICENGFEHHVAINLSQTAATLSEALGKYLGWEVYYHRVV